MLSQGNQNDGPPLHWTQLASMIRDLQKEPGTLHPEAKKIIDKTGVDTASVVLLRIPGLLGEIAKAHLALPANKKQPLPRAPAPALNLGGPAPAPRPAVPNPALGGRPAPNVPLPIPAIGRHPAAAAPLPLPIPVFGAGVAAANPLGASNAGPPNNAHPNGAGPSNANGNPNGPGSVAWQQAMLKQQYEAQAAVMRVRQEQEQRADEAARQAAEEAEVDVVGEEDEGEVGVTFV